jgi:hypothetical protein
MAGDLMSLRDHTRNDRGPLLALVVNGTLAEVDTRDEEGGFGIVCLELIKNIIGVDVRAIIVGNSDSIRNNAIIDAFSTVLLLAELRTRCVTSAASSRD